MLFLLDANMPYSAKDLFEKPHEAFHVRDLNLQDAEDSDIIVLKIPYFYTASDIKRVLNNFLHNADFSSIPKSTIIVEETRFRTKR